MLSVICWQTGADIQHQNNEGNTALHSAGTNFAHEHIVLALLEAGARVDLVNQRKQTPLMLATRLGNINVIRALLEKKADVTTRDQHGMTALLCSGVSFTKKPLIKSGWSSLSKPSSRPEQIPWSGMSHNKACYIFVQDRAGYFARNF